MKNEPIPEHDDAIWMAIASASVLGVLLTIAYGLVWAAWLVK